MCETGGSTALSFEQLLDQHRQHQQQQKQPQTEEDGPMNAQRNEGPALGLRQRNDGPPGFRQRNDEPFRELCTATLWMEMLSESWGSNHLPYLHFISGCFDINILHRIFDKTYHIKPDENKN